MKTYKKSGKIYKSDRSLHAKKTLIEKELFDVADQEIEGFEEALKEEEYFNMEFCL